MATIDQIALLVGGEVVGDGKTRINGMAPLQYATDEDITFAIDAAAMSEAAGSRAACVISTEVVEGYPKPILKVGDMKLAITVLYNAMLEMTPPAKGEIHLSSLISESAIIGNNVAVGPGVVIGDGTRVGDNSVIQANCVIGREVTLGKNTCIYPNVTIYDRMVIGNGVIVHSGTVIGADGFGYITKDGRIYKVPQMGIVVVEDNVEIGANTCIDRGTFRNTVIGSYTKIDNLVQIAHNVKMGHNDFIASQTGIAGSATIGDNVLMGGQVGVADHVTIGDNVKMGAKTGVHGNVKAGETVFGYPMRPAGEERKLYGFLSLLLRNMSKIKKFLRTLPE